MMLILVYDCVWVCVWCVLYKSLKPQRLKYIKRAHFVLKFVIALCVVRFFFLRFVLVVYFFFFSISARAQHAHSRISDIKILWCDPLKTISSHLVLKLLRCFGRPKFNLVKKKKHEKVKVWSLKSISSKIFLFNFILKIRFINWLIKIKNNLFFIFLLIKNFFMF